MSATTGSVVCRECGVRNDPDEDFCGGCGAYLAWNDASDAPADPEGASRPTGRGPIPAVPSGPTPIPDAPPTQKPVASAGSPVLPETSRPTLAGNTAPAAAHGPHVPSVSEPTPAPVQPAKPIRRPLQSAPPAAAPTRPDDVTCPACGARNRPDRHFCHRCANLLRERSPAATGETAQPKARSRPKARRRFPRGWAVLLAVIAVLAGAAWLMRDDLASLVGTVVDRVSGASAVNPSELTASTALDGRGPELARDGFTNRSWAAATAGAGVGEYLEARFADPFRLVYLQVRSGASDDDDAFLAEARPARIDLAVSRADGSTASVPLALEDRPGMQQFDVGIDDVVSVRLTVGDTFGAADGTHVAIAEVEFRGR